MKRLATMRSQDLAVGRLVGEGARASVLQPSCGSGSIVKAFPQNLDGAEDVGACCGQLVVRGMPELIDYFADSGRWKGRRRGFRSERRGSCVPCLSS